MKQYINNAINFATQKVDEIFLFNQLIDYLNTSGIPACFARSVHAHAGFIDFHSAITNKVEKVEIADIMLINHNILKHETRLSFIQAKYKKQNYRKFVSFQGDAIQWDLLTRRPLIVDSYANGFPSNILSFAKHKTITSFGVFYKDRSGETDLLFTLPDHLHPTVRKKRTTLVFPGYYHCPSSSCPGIHAPDETISACQMHLFESSLLSGMIGAPIHSSIRSFIGSTLRSISSPTSRPIVTEVLRHMDLPIDEPGENRPHMNTIVLLTGLEGERPHYQRA